MTHFDVISLNAAGTLLQVKLVQVPFSRDVDLRKQSDGEERIADLANYMHLCQHSKAVVCIARESRLSLELKAQVSALCMVEGALLCVAQHPGTCHIPDSFAALLYLRWVQNKLKFLNP